MESVDADDQSSSSNSSSSWSADDAESQHDDNKSQPSDATISLDAAYNLRDDAAVPPALNADMDNVPADQERQILLLMLLAQVW